MSRPSGASARSLRFARTLSGELADAAEVTITEISSGVSVDLMPPEPGHQPVPVRRAAAEGAALIPDLGRHRRAGAEPVAQHLPLGHVTLHQQQRPMVRLGEIHGAADLRQPHRHLLRGEQGDHLPGVPPGEGPLVLTHDHRVESEFTVSPLEREMEPACCSLSASRRVVQSDPELFPSL
jgi:hypothetical protein